MKTEPVLAVHARDPADLRLPDLRVVSSQALLLHEEHDPERVDRLVRTLEVDGVLRNPPIVAPLDAQHFVVLDGANRVTALGAAGVRDQLVQVVDYDDPAVTLAVWTHLLQDDGVLVRAVFPRPPWQVISADALRAGLHEGALACGIVTGGGSYGLPSGGALVERVRLLSTVVARYKGRTPIYRVQGENLRSLAREYGRAATLVLFPRLLKQDIRVIARLPEKLPTGISRHVVPQRALRVNLDLALLRAADPVAAKQARLDDLIRARLIEQRIRHYSETTVLYDE